MWGFLLYQLITTILWLTIVRKPDGYTFTCKWIHYARCTSNLLLINDKSQYFVSNHTINYVIYTDSYISCVVIFFGYILGVFPESNTDCRYNETCCWSEVIHDIHNGVPNLFRTNHRQLLFRRHMNDDSKYYIYTVFDKRILIIKKIRNFPGCGSHFNVWCKLKKVGGSGGGVSRDKLLSA